VGDRELRRFGPVVVAEDVAAIDTDLARELSRFLDQMGHLLIPGTPEHGVVNALALRLPRRPRSTNYTRPPVRGGRSAAARSDPQAARQPSTAAA
jgi:hypothetical protein